MSKVMFKNNAGVVEPYTFILSTIAHEHLGEITCIDHSTLSVNVNMNSANEVSFDVYEKIYDLDGSEIKNEL